jgi:hypothetical protein
MHTANRRSCYLHVGGLYEDVPTGAARGDLLCEYTLTDVASYVCTQVHIVTVSVEASPTMLDYRTSGLLF